MVTKFNPEFITSSGYIDEFYESYVEAALWSTTDESDESGGVPMDENYGYSDITLETRKKMHKDCEDFIKANTQLLADSGLPAKRAGFLFWLNRNGHGSGFWDEYSSFSCEAYKSEQAVAVLTRDFSKREALNDTCPCPYHVCMRLSKASKVYGSFNLYVGDNGEIDGN